MLHALYGYIWQNASESPKGYTMVLTTHNFTEDEQIEAVARITTPSESLRDYVVYVVTQLGWESTTVQIQDGKAIDVTPPSLPSAYCDKYSPIA